MKADVKKKMTIEEFIEELPVKVSDGEKLYRDILAKSDSIPTSGRKIEEGKEYTVLTSDGLYTVTHINSVDEIDLLISNRYNGKRTIHGIYPVEGYDIVVLLGMVMEDHKEAINMIISKVAKDVCEVIPASITPEILGQLKLVIAACYDSAGETLMENSMVYRYLLEKESENKQKVGFEIIADNGAEC